MSREVFDKIHGGYNFENSLNQTKSCKISKAFASCIVNVQNHCIVLNALLISLMLYP